MKGLRNVYHSYIFCCLLVFVFLLLVRPTFTIYVNTLSTTESLTIASNSTLVSPGDVFELGFFKPVSNSRWYLGLWYKRVSLQRTYVWVANRDNPLSDSTGTLKILNANLVLLDQFDNVVWSTNLTRGDVSSPVVAELLPNGNFVMRYSSENDSSVFLWQSFDFPTDTLLPEMKLGYDLKTGRNRFLRSWRSSDDPSSGNFTYRLDTLRGLPEFFMRNREFRMQRSGPWDGVQFSGIPEARQSNYMVYNFTQNTEEVAYTFLMINHSIYSRLTLASGGSLDRYTWTPATWGWSRFWNTPADHCDLYLKCGPYAYCDINTSPMCNCIGGFDPKNPEEWALNDGSTGCVRRTQLSCRGDGFLRLKKMKLPDTIMAIVDRSIDVKKCKERCLSDCNCTSFANADVRNGGAGCVIWTGELIDIRNYAGGGQDLYVRLAASDLGEERNRNRKIIGWSIGLSAMLLLMSFIIFCIWKRKQTLERARAIATPLVNQERHEVVLMDGVVLSRKRHLFEENEVEDLELPFIEFEAVVIATENFSNSNKLGQGGFGSVYKGKLPDGQEIAVKRLSKLSLQGTNEFLNEVKLIARLQHINLVRLLGCCVDEEEKMLIYEYLENLSLDSHIFDKTQSCKLYWQMRFDIINGIARGLLYLHQDSRCRIIHRDLKASNVLLDKAMIPKISDFGMARIFGQDETKANTRKVVGTYGYMSPEYAMDGIFSMKSDVFSFGVLLLEVISGKRNKGFYNLDHDLNLLGWVWRNWEDGKWLDIVDPAIVNSSSLSSAFRQHEILRCTQIGLLCVQERAEDRPVMSSVVLMLGSETAVIPPPKPPGYCVGRNSIEPDSSSSRERDDELWTVNQTTMPVVHGR